MATVAVMGLGAMGSRMAKALIEAGHQVHVYNVEPGACAPLVALGAQAFETPRAAVAGVEFAIAMVWNDEASAYVWMDEKDGALAALRPGAVALECATLTVAHEARLLQQAERLGVEFVSAPMSGSLPEADNKTLIFTVGARPEVFERVRPILFAMGSKINHAGMPLDGIALKLLINSKLAIEYAAMAEVAAYVMHSGVDAQRFVDIASGTAPFAPRGVRELHFMLSGDETVRVKIDQLVKDSANHIAQCQAHGIACPMVQAAHEVFRKASEAGYGALDAVALARVYREQAQVLAPKSA